MAPDRFVARTVRLKWVFLLFGALCLGLAGLWMIGMFTDGPPFGHETTSRKTMMTAWLAIFASPVVMVIALWYLVAAPDELIIISEAGIISHKILAEGHIAWPEVRSAHLSPVFGGFGARQLRIESKKGKRLSLSGSGTDKSTNEIAMAIAAHLARRRL